MSISIKSIKIQKIGPLSQLQQDLGKLNLFFGLNESGKTYLAEFLLQSLFRSSRQWQLRQDHAEGTVAVVGLEEKPVLFSPGSGRKLEDFWQERELGLPTNLSRLLVVKGGELAFTADTQSGISREVLKTALTSQAVLDEIWDAIQTTVRNASLEEGRIIGSNMGKIKDRDQQAQELEGVSKLLAQIETSYSGGPSRQVELELEDVQRQLDQQISARQHSAHQIAERIRKLEDQKDALGGSSLTQLRDRIQAYKQGKMELTSLEDRFQENKRGSQGYSWLEAAIEVWEEKGLDQLGRPPRMVGIASLLSLIGGLTVLALEILLKNGFLIWPGAALSALGLGGVIYFLYRTALWADQADGTRERKDIQEKFEREFGIPAAGLADLREKKAKAQEFHIKAQTTKSLRDEKQNQLNLEKQMIERSLLEQTGSAVSPADWQSEIDQIFSQQEQLASTILDLKLQLKDLDIPEGARRALPAACEYDRDLEQDLQDRIARLEGDLAGHLEQLNTLKARACERTGDDISASWPEVYHHLQRLRQDLAAHLDQLTAEIVAGIGLTRVLSRLREEEDRKIVQALNSPQVIQLIERITGKYHGLNLADNQLTVQGDYASYALEDLSTGAREQILLAVRLGIASQVCGGEPLFLILDDAFQHSDWQRRRSLVQSTVELAKNGWQLIYLSMDDHIRDLFREIAKPALKNDFRLINLDNPET